MHVILCKLQDKLAKSIIFILLKHQKNSSQVEEVQGILFQEQNNVVFLGVQDVENSKPVFDPDFHTELIIKDEYEDFNSSNMIFFL